MSKIKRRKTRQIHIGGVRIGGNAPISIQSMAKTETRNTVSTIREIKRLEKAGCEIVRVAVKNNEDLYALEKIKKSIRIPLVADIHFDCKLALGAIDRGVDAIRLNPGNIYKKRELKEIINKTKKEKVPIRIGVNSGSLKNDRSRTSPNEGSPTSVGDAMVKSASSYIKHFEEAGFRDIIISLKSSDVLSTIYAYKKMAGRCDYPFHIGVTASGVKEDGIIKSAIGIGSLVSEGIGDTIRVSLTADAVSEVEAAKTILQSLGLRNFGPELVSCPTCGRCQIDLVKVVSDLRDKLNSKRYTLNSKYPISIAVMGCEVNGPGEARNADIGIAAGKDSGALFKKGKVVKRIKKSEFLKELLGGIRKLTAESRQLKYLQCAGRRRSYRP